MEGITNIAKTVLANQDDEVWMELIFYRDRMHRNEVEAKLLNDEKMERLFKGGSNHSSTSFILGEFSRISV